MLFRAQISARFAYASTSHFCPARSKLICTRVCAPRAFVVDDDTFAERRVAHALAELQRRRRIDRAAATLRFAVDRTG